MKKRLIALAQLAFGLAIIGFILLRLQRQGKLHEMVAALQSVAERWPLAAVGVAGFSVCLFFCVVRWNLLLRVVGVSLPFSRLWSLCFVGQFFNAFILGATGGDVIKAVYVAEQTHHKKAEVVATVFIDRVVGLAALVILTVGVMLARLPFFLQHPRTRLALAFNVVFAAVTLGGLGMLLRPNPWQRHGFLRRLEEKTALGARLRKAHDAFRLCVGHPGTIVKTVLLSLLNHTAFIACISYLGLALGLKLTFFDYLPVFLVINTIAGVPITPSGIGTRDWLCVFLLGALGVAEPAALMLSLLIYANMMAWSLIGGVVYFVYVVSGGRVPPAAVAAEP
jgi:uncharacterized protein (TIRG00374 family)